MRKYEVAFSDFDAVIHILDDKDVKRRGLTEEYRSWRVKINPCKMS